MARSVKKEKEVPDLDVLSRPATPNQRRLPFFELHDEDFEEILVEICDKEPGIVRAELKLIGGVAQYGVDVEGFDRQQMPVLVISCKCYKKVIPSNLAKWSSDFLNHMADHWTGKGVKKFVLAVSVDLNSDKLNAQIELERKRFEAVGMKYEVWGLRKLTTKLRPLPHIITQYFHPSWLEMIGAGTAVTVATSLPPRNSSTADAAATSIASTMRGVADSVRQKLGSATASLLETALRDLKQGTAGPLRALVADLRGDRLSWDALTNDAKAKLLRAEGSLAIRDDDLEMAKNSFRDAEAYGPAPDQTAAALLARLESGAETALTLVANPSTSSEASVRAGLLIELGRATEAVEVTQQWPSSSGVEDTYEPGRLRALAQLRLNRNDALATITSVERIAPLQYALQWAAGVVRFNFAISEQLEPTLSGFPNPIPPGLVRDTADARAALDEAEQIFDRLSNSVDTPQQAADLAIWRLACLLINPARLADAQEFAKLLLSGDAPHPGAVVWATSAGLEFDQDAVVRSLNALLKKGGGDASHAVAIAYVTYTRGTKTRAISGLKRHRKLFTAEPDIQLIDYWLALLDGEAGNSETATFNAALGKLRRAGDAGEVLGLLDSDVLDADMKMAAFENLAFNNKWAALNERRAAVLAFGTSQASEIAIRAAFGMGLHREVAELAEQQRQFFFEGRMPTALGVLVAKSTLWMGDAGLALRALEEMRAGDSSNELAFEVAMMRLRIGDLTGAADIIRGRKAPSENPEALLRIASQLRFEDPELARELLQGVSFSELSHKFLPNALSLVHDLGLQTAARIIMPRLFGPGAEPSGIVVIESVEEAIELVRRNADQQERVDAGLTDLWLKGQIPIHLVYDGHPADLAKFFHTALNSAPRLNDDGTIVGKPFLLRSGIPPAKLAARVDTILVDVTAVLLGHEFDLLPHLEKGWKRVVVPNETPELLRTMEDQLEQDFPPIPDAAIDLKGRLEAGQFERGEEAEGVKQLVLRAVSEDDVGVVGIADLLGKLVASGMDADLAATCLRELSLEPTEVNGQQPQELRAVPDDLVLLLRLGILDRLAVDVRVSVSAPDKEAWLDRFRRHADGRKLADKVKSLRQFVAQKAHTGAWQFLPIDVQQSDEDDNWGAAGHLFRSVLRAAGADEMDVWAEDRTLSLAGRLGKSTVINIENVLDTLSAALAAPDNAAVRRKLRNAGYGFRLPSTSAIVDELISAPLNGAELVETDELGAIRRGLAIQFSNSRYLIEKAGGLNPGTPELLFLSKLLGLPGKVLAELWSRANIKDDRAQAAATWAARHLRVEQASFLPRENRRIEGRKNLLFLQFLSIIGSVFDVNGGSFRQARERRTKFLAWVIDRLVDPAVQIHPDFRQRLIDYFAHALSEIAEPDSAYPDVTQEMLVGVLLNYLNAFPDDWKTELQRHEKLRDLVGLRSVQSVDIGSDFGFEASAFYVGIAEALRGGEAVVRLRKGKRNAIISMVPDSLPATDGPVAFMVRTGNKTTHFADDRLELESHDEDRRAQALRRHPSWFDLPPTKFEEAVQSIARESDPARRRELLDSARSRSLAWQLRTLHDQIAKDGTTNRDLLFPPHPDSVRQFLRLEATTARGIETGFLDSSFDQLAGEFGPLGALARIGSLPFEIGSHIQEAIVAEFDEIGLEVTLQRLGSAPMGRTALYAALLAAGRKDLDLGGLASPWSDYGVLFHSLLRMAFRSASSRDEWKSVPDPEKSMLLWAHSSAVLEIMMNQGASPIEAAKVVDSFLTRKFDDLYERTKTDKGRLMDPFSCNWVEIAGAAIGHAVQGLGQDDLSDDQKGSLRGVVAKVVGEEWLLALELWIPSLVAEPDLCWLGIDPADPLGRTGVAVLPPPINERNPNAMAELLVTRIREEATGEEASGYWPVLWLLGAKNLSEQASAQITSLISSPAKLPDLAAKDGGVWVGTLRYRAELYGADGDVASFESLLGAAARNASSAYPGQRVSNLSLRTPVVMAFHNLAEAIWQFSLASTSTLTECTQRFAGLVVELAALWPASLLGCLSLLDVVAAQLDTEPAGPVWDAIHLLRSR